MLASHRNHSQPAGYTISKRGKMIKAILFDGDDTLYQTKRFVKEMDMQVMKRLSRRTKQPQKKLYDEWHAIVKKLRRYKDPKVRCRDYSYSLLLKKYKIKKAAKFGKKEYEFFNRCLIKKMKPMPNIKPVLNRLKKRYKIAVVTNDNRKRAMRKIKKFGLNKYFRIVITSTEVGKVKPEKKYFTLAAKKLGVKTRECLVVGNNPADDIKPAKQLGIKTIAFNGKDGTYNTKNHKELLRILKRLN